MRHHAVQILRALAELGITGSFQFRAKTKRLWFNFLLLLYFVKKIYYAKHFFKI